MNQEKIHASNKNRHIQKNKTHTIDITSSESSSSSSSVLTKEEIEDKIREYTSFIQNTLQPHLEHAILQREQVESDIREYEELKSYLIRMNNHNTNTTQVDDTQSYDVMTKNDNTETINTSLIPTNNDDKKVHTNDQLDDVENKNVEEEKEEVEEDFDEKQRIDDKDTEDDNNQPIHNEAIVDLGYRLLYCRAKITNRNRIYIHVGMGFHVEFTLQEGINFCITKLNQLQQDILPQKVEVAQNIGMDVENALQLLERLAKEDVIQTQ